MELDDNPVPTKPEEQYQNREESDGNRSTIQVEVVLYVNDRVWPIRGTVDSVQDLDRI
ncbi:MAG: hypothetical protein WBW47_02020 [Thermoplasmata archaeon]